MDKLSMVLISKALDGLSMRHLYTAQNVANANTADYRPVSVKFEESLKLAAKGGVSDIEKVQPDVIIGAAGESAGEMRVDLELAVASQTAMRYGGLVEMLGRQLAIHRSAITWG